MSFSLEIVPFVARIPSIAEVDVAQPRYAVAAVAIGALAAVNAVRQNRRLDEQTNVEFPSPDMTESVRFAVGREKHRIGLLTGLAATTLSAGALHAAEFSSTHTALKIDNATVIVDASYNAYPEDIQDGDESTKRIEAVVNGLNALDTSGIDIGYWAAGSKNTFMGETNGKKGQSEVVGNFYEYTAKDLSNRTDSDLAGAVKNALATDSDQVLIFSNQVDDASQFELNSQADDSQHRVSVIQIGKPEAQVDFLGKKTVTIDAASAIAAVGEQDVYGEITSIEDLQSTFNDIKTSQFVTEQERKLGIFKTIRDTAGAALAAGLLLSGVHRNRKQKEFNNE